MELRACYFCGAAGRTVAVRTVEGADVALCPRCEEKLDHLLGADDATPVTFGAGDGTDETSDGPDETGDGTDETSDGPDETGDGTDETGETVDEPADDADGSTGRPPTGVPGLDAEGRGDASTYRKALRLLQNREFPMERAATVDLLSGAYDLDRSECERLLDLTVERGLLVEDEGELRRP
jgi:hypothetical protein